MKKIARIISILCCLIALAGNKIYAAELSIVMNAYTTSDSVMVFLKNQGKDIENIYLGNDEAQDFTVEEVKSVRTVVVLDNSLSINSKYRDSIKVFLEDLVAARKDGDTFTIATFAEDITYLVQESSDYLDIKAKIDALQFENQNSYFNNVLYTAIEDIAKCEEIKYTRIIVIADGVDNEALGYTDDELNRKIQTAKIPIYAIGCSSKGNEENLKKMFAFSRMSNAKSYLLDDFSENDILQDIIGETDIIRVSIVPQDKSCDGTSKAIRISYGEDYCTTEINMPFKAVTEEVQSIESEAEPVSESVSEIESGTEPISEPEDKNMNIPLLLIIILTVVLLVAVIVLILIIVSTRNRKKSRGQTDISHIGHTGQTEMMDRGDNDRTELLNDGSGHKNGINTDLIAGRPLVKLFLQDMDNPSRTFEYPVRNKILIGRNADKCQIVVDYSKYVSSVHCEIVAKGNALYVRDGGGDVVASTNGTFVNGQKVAPELLLPSGAVLKLGKVRFKVTYK